MCHISLSPCVIFFIACRLSTALTITSSTRPQDLSNEVLQSLNVSNTTTAPQTHPVNCFTPYSTELAPAAVEDCRILIDYVLTKYGDPWTPQTFGYTMDVDIDLSEPGNANWIIDRCAMYVRNLDQTQVDIFRVVDVAETATRILGACVIGSKYPNGGLARIGVRAKNFYVGLVGFHAVGSSNKTVPFSLMEDS